MTGLPERGNLKVTPLRTSSPSEPDIVGMSQKYADAHDK